MKKKTYKEYSSRHLTWAVVKRLIVSSEKLGLSDKQIIVMLKSFSNRR